MDISIASKVEIAFVANPYGTLTWTDVTQRVLKISAASGRNYELGTNEASTVTITIDNQDQAFNPLNTASSYYPYVIPFRPVRVTAAASTGGTSYPVWYGYVQKWPQSFLDTTSLYEVVTVTGVDAFKAVLGFVPGDPYDVKVRKDYGAYTGAGASSTSWNLWAFDETAAPFASENTANANALIVLAGTAGPTKTSPSPCRTAAAFNGSQGLQSASSAGAVVDMWFNTTTPPTTPGQGSVIVGGASTASAAAVTLAYLSGIPSQRQFLMAGPDSPLNSGVALVANYVNLMPSDNAASFETSVADWASESANVTIAWSTVNPAVGVAALRASLTAAAGGVISQTTRSTVTAGSYYQVGLSWAGATTANTLTVALRWYGSTGTLLSTSGARGGGTALGAGAYQTGYTTGPVVAPAGATTASIILTVALSTGTTGTIDFDAVGLYGATTIAGLPGLHIAYVPPSAGATTSLYACLGNTTTVSDTFVLPAPSVGAWHHVAFAPKSATGVATVFALDGVAQTSAGTVVNANASLGFQYVACMGNNGTVNTGVYFTGQIAGVWAMTPATGLVTVNAVYAVQHYNYGTTGSGAARTHDFPAQTTSRRVSDVLTSIGIPTAMTSIETGLTTMSASGNVSGTSATALVAAAAVAELGNVFIDPTGIVTFHNRAHRNSPTSVATFGGAGGIPFEVNYAVDFDDTYIYNDVQVTQFGASPSYVFETQDVTSQNTYGIRTLSTSVGVANQSDAQGMGATLLARYKDPHPRLLTLSFELRSKPAYLAQIMTLKIGNLITVNHAPIGGTVYPLQVFIDGISHTVDESQWLITFNTTPLYPNATY